MAGILSGLVGGGGGCTNLGVVSFGCSGTSSSAAATTTATLSTIQTVLQENSTTVSQAGLISQKLTVDLTGATISGNINVSQILTANISFVSSSNANVTTQLLQDLTNQMQQSASSMSSQQEQLLSSALQGQSVSTLISTITDTMQSTLQSQQFQQLMQSYDVSQTLTIPLKGATITGTLDITQSMLLTLQSQAIANLLQSSLLQNTLLASVAQAASSSATGTSTGLQGLLSALFTGPFLIVLAIVILLGAGYFIYSRKRRVDAASAGVPQPAGIMAAAVPIPRPIF